MMKIVVEIYTTIIHHEENCGGDIYYAPFYIMRIIVIKSYINIYIVYVYDVHCGRDIYHHYTS